MQTLASTVQPARRAASQVVAQIAAAELPRSMWVEVIQLLLQNMSSTTDIIREASLETLGFICEEIVRQDSSCSNLYYDRTQQFFGCKQIKF